MNMELGIRLQAYLDGELAGRDAERVQALIESDAEAHALFCEMKETRQLLRANEPEFRLPESREFFWSKIEREISRLETAPRDPRTPAWLLFFRRHLAAVGGTAMIAALALFAALQMNWVSQDIFEEIENPLEDTGSFSFRSESQKMTLVWISSNPGSPEVSVDPMGDMP
jgi:anti-sigma factor RsiW